jgi:hypothetical protein
MSAIKADKVNGENACLMFHICRCLFEYGSRGFEKLHYLVVNCFKITAKSTSAEVKSSDGHITFTHNHGLYQWPKKGTKATKCSFSITMLIPSILPEHNLAIRFGLVVRNTDSSYYAFFNLRVQRRLCPNWPCGCRLLQPITLPLFSKFEHD